MIHARLAAAFVTTVLLGATRLAGGDAEPSAALDAALAMAESSLQDDEWQAAESHYHDALLEGWLLRGSLDLAADDTQAALAAFEQAAASAVETHRAHVALALVNLRIGRATEAVRLLRDATAGRPRDVQARLLLAQALVADGQPGQAVQELEEARAAVPDDAELAFTLASGYLRLQKDEAAEKLFAEVARRRPIPQTHVLIGRTYRDFGRYALARAALETALAQDPRVRRAHYYLGTVEVLDEGAARLEQAIAHLREELKLAPQDPLANLYLGVALVERRRYAEARPALELAVLAEPPALIGVRYLGRCYLGLERPADAVPHLRHALQMLAGAHARENELSSVHYQLGQALRQLGDEAAAGEHFEAARRYTAQLAETWREQLGRYLGGEGEAFTPPVEVAALAGTTPERRAALRERTTAALARAYLTLGVMHAQAGRFARAAELFERTQAIDPDFPRLQYSLGVAYFSAGQYDQATRPLSRALADTPQDDALRRMLALAWFNGESYSQAAEMLAGDAERARNPSLQYTYGVALVRSGRAAEAQAIFGRLLTEHGESPEIHVVLGQAYAQQGDYAAAARALQHALTLAPDVTGAHASLGLMHLKKGELPEAERELRAELGAHPADTQSRYLLATVLDLSQRTPEALALLRAVIASKPGFADARYLAGKILLASGAPRDAVGQLEAAARLSPEDANVRYQLAQAYRRLGRDAQAEEQFEAHRRLKQKQRSSTP